MEEWNNAENRVLRVTAGSSEYYLPVSAVESVVSLRPGSVYPVAYDTGGLVRGIFNNKGRVVALLHCSALTPDSDSKDGAELIAVILKNGEKRFALPVDSADTLPAGDQPPCLSVEKLYRGEVCYDG